MVSVNILKNMDEVDKAIINSKKSAFLLPLNHSKQSNGFLMNKITKQMQVFKLQVIKN